MKKDKMVKHKKSKFPQGVLHYPPLKCMFFLEPKINKVPKKIKGWGYLLHILELTLYILPNRVMSLLDLNKIDMPKHQLPSLPVLDNNEVLLEGYDMLK